MSERPIVVTGQVLLDEAIPRARTAHDALEIAIRQHARLVYRIAFSVLRNHHDAEDATQEAFLRVLRYRRKLVGVDDPRTWLARIAWRVAVGRKKKKPDVSVDDVAEFAAELRAADAPADMRVLGQEVRDLLLPLITTLPQKLRDPLILSTLEEMSPADISAVLKVSEAAVRSRIFRAREILKDRLAARLRGAHEIR